MTPGTRNTGLEPSTRTSHSIVVGRHPRVANTGYEGGCEYVVSAITLLRGPNILEGTDVMSLLEIPRTVIGFAGASYVS